MSKEIKLEPYLMCHDCGTRFGTPRIIFYKEGSPICMATYHVNKCDVCEKTKACTEARDYSYPTIEISQDELNKLREDE